jgi:VanZ family protein
MLHMGLIFVASSRSDLDPLPGNVLDKIVHFGVYAVLGALIARALARGRLETLDWRHVALAVLLSTLYGASDEWHQGFVPRRTPDAMDVVADALGAGAGAAFVFAAHRFLTARRSTPAG